MTNMKRRNKTQRFSGKILKRLLKREDYAEFTGDLDEVYESMKNEGSGTKADIWYLWRIIESIPAIITENFYWSIAMIRNYIKIALRNIKNHKIFSFINIFGLSIGMSCCLITLVIVDNMVSDKTQENAENLYRVIRESQVGGQSLRGTGTPFMLDEALKNDYSEILNTVQLISTGKTLISYEGNKFNEHGVYYTDDEIFEVFTLHFAAGNPKTALSDPMSIIINEEIALKYFGDTDPIGKTLNVDNESDLVVTAVIYNMPEGSNFDFRVIIPLSYYSSRNNVTSWDDYYSETYVLLDKNSSHEKMNPLLADWAKKYTDKEDVYSLQPFNEIRLYGLDGSGEIYIVYIFTALSILVLLIGCINFMNLSTARSGSRALEIGLRKVVGAKKKDVIIQSLGESIIFAFLSLAVSFVLVYLSLPYINSMGDVSLNLSITPDLTMIGGCILITLITGVLSGCYPAFYISAFQPVRIIQGISRTNPRAAKLRQILVVAQFTFTLTFIIVTIVLHQQLSYMKTADMGFQRDNIVILDMDETLRGKYESIRSEILTSPDVTTVTAADCYPYGPIGGYRGVDWDGKNPEDEFIFFGYRISPGFVNAFELNIIEGQDFSNVQPEDYTKIILNEAAVEKLGFENPIGKRLTILETNGEIIGVIKNFNYRTIDNLIEPL
ncbi:MAG: FtsX-like permease family protein, partial [bacterium]|nr:FtsX-like permease family protein [bacterium]